MKKETKSLKPKWEEELDEKLPFGTMVASTRVAIKYFISSLLSSLAGEALKAVGEDDPINVELVSEGRRGLADGYNSAKAEIRENLLKVFEGFGIITLTAKKK